MAQIPGAARVAFPLQGTAFLCDDRTKRGLSIKYPSVLPSLPKMLTNFEQTISEYSTAITL